MLVMTIQRPRHEPADYNGSEPRADMPRTTLDVGVLAFSVGAFVIAIILYWLIATGAVGASAGGSHFVT
jgi:hypothetical protein